MKRYPTYKQSGVEWLGEIPNDWNSTIFNRVLKEIKDGTHGSFKRVEEGRVLLSAKNVQSDKIEITEDESLICEDDYISIIKNGFPQKNDLLLTIVGTIGRAYVYDLDYPLAFQRSVAFLRLHKNNNVKFYYYQVQSNLFLSQLFSLAKTSAQSGVYLSDIKGSIALVPPLIDQNSIVRFLDYKTAQIDSFIANRQKQIELLKEQKAGIINKAVTKGINPNAKMKASGIEWIGDIPEHWRVSKVKFVSKVKGRIGFRGYTVNDLVEEGQGALTLGATHINKDGEIDLSKAVYISWDKYYESPEIMVEKEDILVVQRGSVGVVGIVNYDIGLATINPSLVVLKKIKMNRQLLFLQLRSKIVKEGITTIFNETAVPMLSQNQISNFNILLPPTLDEQQSIIDYIKSEVSIIDTLISKYQKQIDLMQEYRTSLISQAVTGKIDVRDWKPKIKEYSIEKPENLLVAEE